MAWTVEQHMLSMVEHNTRIGWWMKTKDGSNNRRPPERLTPPKSVREQKASSERGQRVLQRTRARAATKARLNN